MVRYTDLVVGDTLINFGTFGFELALNGLKGLEVGCLNVNKLFTIIEINKDANILRVSAKDSSGGDFVSMTALDSVGHNNRLLRGNDILAIEHVCCYSMMVTGCYCVCDKADYSLSHESKCGSCAKYDNLLGMVYKLE